jgi:Fe2+ transport system protein FeoA
MEKTLLICNLCGHKFEEGAKAPCGECPLHKGCELTCCPNCGYTNFHFPDAKKPLNFWKKEKAISGKRSMQQVQEGETISVHFINTNMPKHKLSYLVSRGVMPGKSMQVVQNKPTLIVEINHMLVAIEQELAGLIYVE